MFKKSEDKDVMYPHPKLPEKGETTKLTATKFKPLKHHLSELFNPRK